MSAVEPNLSPAPAGGMTAVALEGLLPMAGVVGVAIWMPGGNGVNCPCELLTTPSRAARKATAVG